jgi:hypothetical protein
MSRIDWHDAEKNTVIFDGKDYIHLRNGIQVKRCSDDTGPKFKELFGLESLIGSFNVLDEEISEEGNIITVQLLSLESFHVLTKSSGVQKL